MNERYIRWWTPHMSREFEMLVVGNCVLHKEQQSPALKSTYHQSVELD